MFLEAVDCDLALQRVLIKDPDNGAFLKKAVEPTRCEDEQLARYYSYEESKGEDWAEKLTFGGSFWNMSKLSRRGWIRGLGGAALHRL
mgnify:CR=1 FL=1